MARGHPRLLAPRPKGQAVRAFTTLPAPASRLLTIPHWRKKAFPAFPAASYAGICEAQARKLQGTRELGSGTEARGRRGAEARSRKAASPLGPLVSLSSKHHTQKCKSFLKILTPPQKCFHLALTGYLRGIALRNLRSGCRLLLRKASGI